MPSSLYTILLDQVLDPVYNTDQENEKAIPRWVFESFPYLLVYWVFKGNRAENSLRDRGSQAGNPTIWGI